VDRDRFETPARPVLEESKNMWKTIGVLAVATGMLALVAAVANARPRGGGATGKRNVIAEAVPLCASSTDADLDNICDLIADTNGEQITSSVCADLANGDNGVVDYSGRNCDKNEEALLRRSSSAALALDDFLARTKGAQLATAADYLCKYAAKATALAGVGKFDDGSEDLAADATDIAESLAGSGTCD